MSTRDAIRRRIPSSWVKRWPAVRAVLVTYHVLALVVLSFPSPPSGMQRSAWENPTVQNEFKLWAARISSLGWELDAKSLDALLWDVSKKYVAGREKVVAPFDPYTTYTGARQSWRMFVAPQRFPVRIEVSVREGSRPWQKVYESRSAEHAWLAHLLEKYRLRRIVFATAWDKDARQFKMLCDWLAKQAARDFPAATEVMIRQQRYRTPTPEEALLGKTILEGQYLAREVRKLERPK
jgi:hypothetical protein